MMKMVILVLCLSKGSNGWEIVEKIVLVLCYVLLDFYWVVMYNKGIMNGIEVVVLVIGNDICVVSVFCYVFVVKEGCY